MANIKELKKRIKSTKSTLKITSAMKLVSAAKLNKAQNAILGARPYSSELNDTIKVISALTEGYEHPFITENEHDSDSGKERAVLLIISADRGLCGGYNNNLYKRVRNFLAENNDKYDFQVHYIGKKVRDLIKSQVNSGETYTWQRNDPTYEEVKAVAEILSNMFTTGEVGKVFLAYNQFKSAIEFNSTVSQLLPMTMSEEEATKLKEEFPFDFKYDETPSDILDVLIPESFYTSVYTAMLDAIAAEHGSRMSAMDSASKNSKEVIRKLTLKMNKLRQAAITTELIEVISGAESLNG